MKLRDVIVGVIIVAILGGAIYFWQTRGKALRVPEDTPAPSAEGELEESFDVTLPEDAEKIELKSAVDEDIAGIASRLVTEDSLSMTILADLPDPSEGSYYQAWLVGNVGGEDYESLSIGRLSVAKGGYILNFEAQGDYSNYEKVVVSREEIPDKDMEEIVLEGTF